METMTQEGKKYFLKIFPFQTFYISEGQKRQLSLAMTGNGLSQRKHADARLAPPTVGRRSNEEHFRRRMHMETFQQVMYWFFAALLAAALVLGALFIKKRKSED